MAEGEQRPGGKLPKKGIYTYQAPWLIYGMNWSARPDFKFRLAVGSFIEEYKNKVNIISLDRENTGEFSVQASFDHPYPTTKILWNPDRNGGAQDLLATTGDYLRIWKVNGSSVKMKSLLNPNKMSEFCAPLTSFDWNETDPSIVGTSSIDTTCTIWDINAEKPKTQLIAHDKEVYDIAFAQGTDIFASVGADGSARIFDLRHLEHSTIIYETPEPSHLLRLAWNRHDGNYLATFGLDSNRAIILDIRVPNLPVAELDGHSGCLNGIAWAPHSSCHLCTGGDDAQALIWDLSSLPKQIEGPILAYGADEQINQLQWSSTQPDWIAIAFGSKLQILRV